MGLFGKRKKNEADNLDSKRKGAFNVLNNKASSAFAKTMAVVQIAVFFYWYACFAHSYTNHNDTSSFFSVNDRCCWSFILF